MSSSSIVANPFAGVFPIVSYLHVPGKMSHPLWLMLGTCFMIEAPRYQRERAPYVFLTAAHTFVPWNFMSGGSEKALKIPVEFRKSRFVVGTLFGFDPQTFVANPAQRFQLKLVALHPTLDVAMLSMSGADSDAFAALMKRQQQPDHRFVVSATDAAVSDESDAVVCCGFRGSGVLGETDTLDADVINRMSKDDQAALMKELQSVEGKQQGTASGLRAVRRGVGRLTHGKCFNGMSGAPMQQSTDSKSCVGILYGLAHFGKQAGTFPPDESDYVGYVPSSAIFDWCTSQGAF